jgi:hypothetical protein
VVFESDASLTLASLEKTRHGGGTGKRGRTRPGNVPTLLPHYISVDCSSGEGI